MSDAHWATSTLASDEFMMLLAHGVSRINGGGQDGDLAARLHLDRELRAMAGTPGDDDYARAADACARAGREEDAALLRRIAAAGTLMRETEDRWNHRYDSRLGVTRHELIAEMHRAGPVDLDPGGPYAGTDSAAYEPGVHGLAREPFVIVTGRGGSELITGWADYAAMSGWIAGRGTTGSGELTPPPVLAAPRTWREEVILARLVSSPGDVPLLTEAPVTAFTTDMRYETYEAVLRLGESGAAYRPEAVASEVARKVTLLPAYAQARYGGARAPWAHAYVTRLAQTVVTAEEGQAAARALCAEDRRHRVRPLADRRQAPRPQPRNLPAGPMARAVDPRLRPPGPVPGAGLSPAPGR